MTGLSLSLSSHPLAVLSSRGPALNQSNAISEAIQLLPLYSMALQKNLAFRGGTDVRTDERANVQSQLANMPIDHSRCFTYPRMFRYTMHILLSL